MNSCFSVCLLLCGVLCFYPAAAQTLYIFPPATDQAPAITTRLYIYDKDWRTQTGFSAADFRVVEDGIPRSVVQFSCEPSPLPPQMSAILTIDVSGSMDWPIEKDWSSNADPNIQRIEMARQAGALWIDAWPDGWECALTSFQKSAAIVRDFTTDKSQLRQGVISLRPDGGTSYANAFLDPKAGALTLAARAKNKPVIVLLTDGESQDRYSANDIIAKAKKAGAAIYCICLGMPAPPDLNKIASQTGGICYDRIYTQAELMEVYRRVVDVVLNVKPCTLTWNTELNCTAQRHVEISLPALAVSNQTSYTLGRLQIPHTIIDPIGIELGFIAPGATKDTSVTIKAGPFPITITNIVSSTTAIRTEAVTLPFTLQASQQRTLRVTFAPNDSAQMYADLTLEGTMCHGNTVQFTGGFPGIVAAAPTLHLLSPNGGEILPVGKKATITWKGTLPDDTLSLEYSIDGGKNWTQITDRATNFSYDWDVPNTPSTTCLMQAVFNPTPRTNAKSDTTLLYHDRSVTAVDFKADTLVASSDDSGIIICMDSPETNLNTTARTYDVRFSPNAKLLAVASGNQAEIWEKATGALLQTLQHKLIVYTAEFDPTGRRVLTASGDETAKIWNVDTGTELFTIEPDAGAGIVFCACFDGSGNRVYTGHENGTFGVWNAVTGVQDKIVPAHSEMIYSIDNNPADNTLATGSRDGSVKIWNSITGDLVTTFLAEGTEVRAIAYDPTGRLLAAGCEDGTVKIWDIASKELALTLIAHGDIITDISFAPDGLHLATSSFDSTVKIWDVRYRGVMRDTSDAFWTIAAPIVKAKDIDFGDVYVTTSKDSVVHEFLVNEGIIPARIDSVRISGTGKAAFANDMNIEGVELPAGARRNATLRFTPPAVGLYEAKFTVYYHGLYGQYTLRGRGIRPPVELIRKEIDFGRVQVGTGKDTTDVVLRNIGTAPVTVASVEVMDPNADLFSVLSAVTPFVLQPDEEYHVSLRFSPVVIGSASSQLVIRCNAVSFPLDISLFGTGVGQAVVDMGPPAEFPIACYQQSTSQSLQVVNPFTNASVTITNVHIEGAHAGEFSATAGAVVPFIVAPGGTHDITIRCTPAQAGIRQADLILDAKSSMGESVFFRQLRAEKDTLAFGLSTSLVEMNGLREFEAKSDSVGVMNTGTAPLAFAVPQTIGGFAVDSVAPNPILPGGSGFIYIHYSGGAQGTIDNQQFISAQACSAISVQLLASVQKWPSVLAQSMPINTLAFPALLCIGEQRDTTIELSNTGPAPVTIASISTSGTHSGDFIVTFSGNRTLAPQESTTLHVRFTPAAPGVRTATMLITTSVNDSTFALPLSGTCSRPDLDITSDLDMGSVQKATATTAVVALHNTGDVPLTWSIPAVDGYFSVVSIDPPTAQPGEVSKVTILFSGASVEGSYKGTLVFEHPCGTDKSVGVRIQVSDIPLIAARVGTAQGAPGDIITVPVYLDAPSALADRGIEYCTTTLRYNASLLVPVGNTPLGTVGGGERSIPLVIPVDGTQSAPALELRFSVALGNDTSTVLRLDSVIAVGGTARTTVVNGAFTLTGICREGGIRLFDGAATAGLSLPAPSPAQERANIVYSIIEAGPTSMTIVDMLGHTTAVLFSGVVVPGVYELSIPTNTLSSGRYFVLLHTPTQTFTQQLHIAR